MAWENRITGEAMVDPATLTANPLNWRTHPKNQVAALRGSLDSLGWVQRIIVNTETGHVVDGHARLEEAQAAGEQVPVLYVSLTEEEERQALATLDPISALAGANTEALTSLLAGVTIESDALRRVVEDLAPSAPVDGLTDPDAIPEVDEPLSALGDLWILGDHRLLCGDATQAEDVERLLDGARPNLMVTDPPYGVEYDPSWRDIKQVAPNRRRGEVANDDRADWAEAWSLFAGHVAYVWHGGLFAGLVASGIQAAGFEMRGQVVWVKPQHSFGRGAYHWKHEPCWYAVRTGATADWIGGRKQTTVWEIEQVRANLDNQEEDTATNHGTQKPVECMERPLRNHSGDVYDPFLGSGTTLIAAERLGRRCYGMEIEPKYVDVAVKRWEAFTGQKAEVQHG
jgi:DNA modification methylase